MIKIGVIFGGRSGEHEVSLVSATSVIQALNPKKYEIVEIGITHDGIWLTGKNCLKKFKSGTLGSFKNLQNLEDLRNLKDSLSSEGSESLGNSKTPGNPGSSVGSGDSGDSGSSRNSKSSGNSRNSGSLHTFHLEPSFVDIAFPVLHGPYGEDGTIQGLFEMLNVPYVGCGVLASSTAMDKLQCKALWDAARIPIPQYIGFNRKAWEKEKKKIIQNIKKTIGFPCFIKPANMGSSVGISKVKTEGTLGKAIDLAAKFDARILAEKAINAREIECAILGNDDPVASPLGEVLVGGEFYDFNDKYINGVSTTKVPADIDKKTAKKIQEYCIKAFKLIDCSGLARVDTFLDKTTGEIFLNEINTMPGFTSISMYPKMMEAYGMSYEKLVDTLIELGFERYKEKQKNQIRFDSGSDWFKE